MKKSDKQLLEILIPIWDKYKIIYPILDGFQMPVIVFDGRIRKYWAECQDTIGVIRINKYWFADNKELYVSDIIPHEVAHQIVYNFFGNTENDHCWRWAAIMSDYGIEPKETY